MTKETCSAEEMRDAISTKLEEAGLSPTYRVVPARLVPPAADGHNWHFIDVLTGNVQ